MARGGPTGPGGLVIVDKPAGMSSHDVVGKIRRIAHTRRVGHAGTLDPMATGVLVLGVERATRLLNHLVLTDKTYLGAIRLGAATSTDDATGEVLGEADASGLDKAAVEAAMVGLTGPILQRPSAVSAIKVAGQRAYARFELLAEPRAVEGYCDLDVLVDCSSGTYIRALARDLGQALGVGGHLTALRRTRVGPFTLDGALNLTELSERADPIMLPLPVAIEAAMPVRTLSPDEARELSYGRTIPVAGIKGTYGGIGPDG